MRRKFIQQAAKKLIAEHGSTLARKAGDKAAYHLSDKARQRGYLSQSYDLRGLTQELKEMHRDGRLSRREWEQAKEMLRQRFRDRFRRKG
ncbi:MAG: hypothetical protein V5A14_00535 [Desulfohalobiaceae bacterium]